MRCDCDSNNNKLTVFIRIKKNQLDKNRNITVLKNSLFKKNVSFRCFKKHVYKKRFKTSSHLLTNPSKS